MDAWGQKALWAANQGDARELSKALSKDGASGPLKLFDEDGLTPLMLAAHAGSVDCVRMLMPFSFATDRDKHWRTALMHAVDGGSFACAKLIAACGQAIQMQDMDGKSALMLSAEDGKDRILEELLRAGHAKDSCRSGSTALHLAAANSRPGAVALLLARSDPDAVDSKGRNALMRAIEAHCSESARILLPKTNPRSVDFEGRSLASYARRRYAVGFLAMANQIEASARALDDLGELRSQGQRPPALPMGHRRHAI